MYAGMKIRITMTNNSDARVLRVLAGVVSPSALRHNGGKVVVAIVHSADRAAVEAALVADHRVVSYEVSE